MSQPEPKPAKRREAKAPFQFGLKHLFLATLCWAIICAIAVQFGAPGVTLSIGLALVVVGLWPRLPRPGVVVAGAFLSLLSLLFVSPLDKIRVASRRGTCTNNLKQIGLALHNYEDVYGCLPPAYIPSVPACDHRGP